MIATVAVANDLPLYTCNPADFPDIKASASSRCDIQTAARAADAPLLSTRHVLASTRPCDGTELGMSPALGWGRCSPPPASSPRLPSDAAGSTEGAHPWFKPRRVGSR